MKNCDQKTKFYNPNKFNGLDGAICFIIALLVLTFGSAYISYAFKDFFKSLLNFDTYAYMCLSVFISQTLLFIVVAVFSLIKRVNPITGGGYKVKWDGVQILMAILLTVGSMMLFYFTHLELTKFAGHFYGGINDIPQNFSPLTPLFTLLYIVEISVLPAFIEEIIFRGTVMKGFSEFGGLFAVVCSSVAFSLMHGSFNQMLLQFIGGLVIGAVVMITKNFLLGMIMHFTNNLFSIVYAFYVTPIFDGSIGSNVSAVLGGATIILGAVFFLTGIIYFGSMLVEKEKTKALGKSVENKYEKKRTYALKTEGQIIVADFERSPDYYSGEQTRYYIFGKFRKMNFKSPKKLTFILIGVGIAFAIICIYFGL